MPASAASIGATVEGARPAASTSAPGTRSWPRAAWAWRTSSGAGGSSSRRFLPKIANAKAIAVAVVVPTSIGRAVVVGDGRMPSTSRAAVRAPQLPVPPRAPTPLPPVPLPLVPEPPAAPPVGPPPAEPSSIVPATGPAAEESEGSELLSGPLALPEPAASSPPHGQAAEPPGATAGSVGWRPGPEVPPPPGPDGGSVGDGPP